MYISDCISLDWSCIQKLLHITILTAYSHITNDEDCMSLYSPVGAIIKIANRNFRSITIMIIAIITSIIVQRVLRTIWVFHLVSCLFSSYFPVFYLAGTCFGLGSFSCPWFYSLLTFYGCNISICSVFRYS